MKKLIYSMFALAIMAMTLNSCEDVPAPYALPGDDDPVVIEPTGDGTLENPFNVAAIINITQDLGTGEVSNQDYYFKGKVVSIRENYDYVNDKGQSYGNATFYISDDGTPNGQFYVYRTKYLGNKTWKEGAGALLAVGDEVIICGKVTNYNGTTPETDANNSFLYSLNGVTEGGGEGGGEGKGSGTLDDPYDALGAANAVKNLTWTSNTEYEKTGDVYVKGKISRIADKGTFGESGTFGNATFYISEDGSESDEFYCFRILYFGNKKFESGQTDIKVGDEVVIYGKLMNYRGNTPETVANEAYLISLNGATDGGSGSGGGDDDGGDDDSSDGNSVSFATNSGSQTWAAATDGTYGSGFRTTTQGLNIGYYKHTSSSNPVSPNDNHVRVYKNSALIIASTDGKKIKKIVIGCAPNAGSTSYCSDMTGLEGGANATADKSALTVTWNGSASKVVLHANNTQVRMEKLTVVFE